ncbi:MAG TPA: cytochrome P450 [Alphaproteobacteria bacterium]|jgi:cytochrome P450|nr:cytochrome P450 [Alphaproteobacteria bacterium]
MAVGATRVARAFEPELTEPFKPVAAPEHDFDLEDLRTDKGPFAKLKAWVLDHLNGPYAVLRTVWPIVHLPGQKALVTRWDDVTEVLGHDKIFRISFGDKVKLLNDGPNFLLGMDDGPDYRRQHRQVMAAFRRDDIDRAVRPLAARRAAEIVEAARGRLDAPQDLFMRVAVDVCRDYYGLQIDDDEWLSFAWWSCAMNTYLFADPGDNPAFRRAAVAGAERIRAAIDASIARARTRPDGRDTVQARLIDMQARGAEGLTDEMIRTYLVGMVIGFVPTNTVACGLALDHMLDDPAILGTAQDAVAAGDDDLLRRCLLETLRLRPAVPLPFRRCGEDYMLAAGTPRATHIRAGTMILSAAQSAMRDGRHVKDPTKFDPARPATDSLVFGYGLHWCTGVFIAEAHLVQTFKALLAHREVTRALGKAGKLETLGFVPRHLTVEYAV